MKDATELRRAVLGVLLGIAYGAVIGLLARRERNPARRNRWAGGSKA